MPHRQMQMLLMVRRQIIRYDVKRTPISGFKIAQKMGIIVIPYSGLSRKARREVKKISPDVFYLEPGDGREYFYYDDTIGNGGLQALYDKSNGFYRRQLILTTKEKQKSLGIIFDDKCIGACRRFHNVDLNPFVPLSGKTPWD